MIFAFTTLLFFGAGWLVMILLQKVHPSAVIANPFWEALILGILSGGWMVLQRFLPTSLQGNGPVLIVWATIGATLGAAVYLTIGYFTDSTGKGRYTLRNLYLLLWGFRLVVYSISIVLFALPAML